MIPMHQIEKDRGFFSRKTEKVLKRKNVYVFIFLGRTVNKM